MGPSDPTLKTPRSKKIQTKTQNYRFRWLGPKPWGFRRFFRDWDERLDCTGFYPISKFPLKWQTNNNNATLLPLEIVFLLWKTVDG